MVSEQSDITSQNLYTNAKNSVAKNWNLVNITNVATVSYSELKLIIGALHVFDFKYWSINIMYLLIKTLRKISKAKFYLWIICIIILN